VADHQLKLVANQTIPVALRRRATDQKSGQALLKDYDLCEYGRGDGFIEMHLTQKANPDDGTRPLTWRTAQRYMQLARDWSRLTAQQPDGFSSQRQVFKALVAIALADRPKAIGGGCAARGKSASGGCAARGATGGKRARTSPVWWALGSIVKEALRLVSSVDETLDKLVSRAAPVRQQDRCDTRVASVAGGGATCGYYSSRQTRKPQ